MWFVAKFGIVVVCATSHFLPTNHVWQLWKSISTYTFEADPQVARNQIFLLVGHRTILNAGLFSVHSALQLIKEAVQVQC